MAEEPATAIVPKDSYEDSTGVSVRAAAHVLVDALRRAVGDLGAVEAALAEWRTSTWLDTFPKDVVTWKPQDAGSPAHGALSTCVSCRNAVLARRVLALFGDEDAYLFGIPAFLLMSDLREATSVVDHLRWLHDAGLLRMTNDFCSDLLERTLQYCRLEEACFLLTLPDLDRGARHEYLPIVADCILRTRAAPSYQDAVLSLRDTVTTAVATANKVLLDSLLHADSVVQVGTALDLWHAATGMTHFPEDGRPWRPHDKDTAPPHHALALCVDKQAHTQAQRLVQLFGKDGVNLYAIAEGVLLCTSHENASVVGDLKWLHDHDLLDMGYPSCSDMLHQAVEAGRVPEACFLLSLPGMVHDVVAEYVPIVTRCILANPDRAVLEGAVLRMYQATHGELPESRPLFPTGL